MSDSVEGLQLPRSGWKETENDKYNRPYPVCLGGPLVRVFPSVWFVRLSGLSLGRLSMTSLCFAGPSASRGAFSLRGSEPYALEIGFRSFFLLALLSIQSSSGRWRKISTEF